MTRFLLPLVLALTLSSPAWAAERSTVPGTTDPRVSQDNIQTTICRRGYTSTVRPPNAYTRALKLRQLAAMHETGPASAWTEDHLIPLSLGGHPTAETNLWPQPLLEARLKDADEAHLHAAVCAGRMTLLEAQSMMLCRWGRQPE